MHLPSFYAAVGAFSIVGLVAVPLPDSCDHAIVGGGWAGVYTAYRLALESQENLCLFEGSDRIGGRTYSHSVYAGKRQEKFTLDVGAYRFSPDMHLPGDIIIKNFNLRAACYEPGCPPANTDFPAPFQFNYTKPLLRLVDDEGLPVGYATALEAMLAVFKHDGHKVFMNAMLIDAIPLHPSQGTELHFNTTAGVRVVKSNKLTMLNLPRNKIQRLKSLRAATSDRIKMIQDCVKFDLPTNLVPPNFSFGTALVKAYAYYEDAWWHTKLNRTVGQYPTSSFFDLLSYDGIPIGIHFNDGPVRCAEPLKDCRGFLEVYYAASKETFYSDLRPDPEHPLGIVNGSSDDAQAAMLRRLHTALMEATDPLWTDATMAKPTDPPTLLMAGVWDRQGKGYTAPTKVYYSTSDFTPGGPDPLEKACGVPGLDEVEYRQAVLFPTLSSQILVANNDWVAQNVEYLFGDWAEESLLQAERGLRKIGYKRPDWLDKDYYQTKVEAFVDVAADAFVV